ncbi:hypothetical protein AB833_20440 [Chromatiales bacterium (ex Bugula neritina AB1)]|nr:hypothetical protein AB833_20440 [Chromatiales bacterium (ex Bugula neritina AB1)]
MLLDLRDGIRNSKWLKYLLVTVICIPFALFGVNSYFNGGGADYAAKVNGEKVSLNAFNNAYQNQRAQLAQAFGGRIPEGFNAVSIVGNQAMDSVVTREVMRQAAVANGFAVGDEDLANQLFDIDAFAIDGQFDKERYQVQLQSMGISAAEFESQFRNDLLMQQLRESVVDTGFSLAGENETITRLREQKRQLSSIVLNVQEKADSIEVADEDSLAYYEENKSDYNNPEKVKVEYIELKIDDLKENVETDESALLDYYEQNKTQWVALEKRDASHILLSVDSDASDSEKDSKLAEAQALIDRINSGESFEEIATALSDDTGSAENGGSLGEFGTGVMVAPFEEAVFAMQEGDLSEPVLSDFGYHIIRLNKIIPERGKSYEEVKEEVENQFRTNKAENKFFEVSELLSNAAYENNDSLEPASDETGLSIQTSDWIDINTTSGIGQYRQVVSAALTEEVLDNGINSEVLEVGENHVIVLRTLEHEIAKPKPFEEVREAVIKSIQTERATEEHNTLAANLILELEGSANPAELAEANGAEYSDEVAVGRSDPEVDSELVRAIFTMPKPAAGSKAYRTIETTSGDIAVLIFGGIAEDEEAGTVAEAVAASVVPATSDFENLLISMEASAEVEKNTALLSENPQY